MAGFRADKLAASDKSRSNLLKGLAIAAMAVIVTIALTGALLWNTLFAQMPTLPSKAELWSMNREPAIEFLDEEGNTLAVRGPRYGNIIAPSDLPPHVIQAFLSVEDQRFYKHTGVDRWAILRAALANWRAGETVQGGSTLTQQLVKNLFLTSERTLRRKAQEARLASELEQVLSKEEILELYINRIFLGSRSYGLDAASETYFGKSPKELTVAEAALIAGLPQAPSRYSPYSNMDLAIERRNLVISRMVDNNYITPSTGERAQAEPITLVEEDYDPRMGYILDEATAQAHTFSVSKDVPDLVVTLTVNPKLQAKASDLLVAKLDEIGESKKIDQGAILIMDKQGAIRAMVGGRDYAQSQFNRATQAMRQPGSAFKAFVFAAALEDDLHPQDVRRDDPISIDGWKPKNYGGGYRGPVTLSEAFAKSLNTVAASLGQEVGMEKVVSLASRFGVSAPLTTFPSVALGSDEIPLYDMTRAYGVFATGGKRFDPWLIKEVRNSRGDLLFERQTPKPLSLYSDARNREMISMMSRVVIAGTGKAARLEMPTSETSSPQSVQYRDVAGKTGTSQDWRDALFIGFTADYVGGVWVGNDDDTPMKNVTGGETPAQLWHDIMLIAHENLPATPLPGAEKAITISAAEEEKLAYYRSLSQAFASIEKQ
ncbi:transglycosylase domain-containing protein [Hirschia litorea]|uniref:peptidoglycan glycosyltransferase n=1 Tax=Hirschia litorea TaxID=1199156 RepID=A0ABW2IIG7_9PROT